MESHKVLAKLHRLTDSFKKQFKEDRGSSEIDQISLSHNARHILGVLYHNEKLNQRAIAIEMHISAQAVSETLKKLENNGCIERVSGVQNNENFIVLTKLGEELAMVSEMRIKRHANQVFRNLSDEEIEFLDTILDKLLLSQE
ncbi:MAG: MarR family transcriptional regulator [Lachnospiraceae bacterium]